MKTAKLFRHGGGQAVRLPKAFQFEGNEVLIERKGSAVFLQPVPVHRFRSFQEIARHLAATFPNPEDFSVASSLPMNQDSPAPEF